MQIRIDPDVEKFIEALEKQTVAKVLRTIDLLGMPHSKKVTVNLFELRTRGQQEVRIFYFFSPWKGILIDRFH